MAPRLERGYVRRGADDIFIDLDELLRIVYHPATRPEIQHAFTSHLANCLGSEAVPVTAGPGPNFLEAMAAHLAEESPREFLAALQEVARDSLELTHRLREIFGSRETTVEPPRNKRQRVEDFWGKVFELFGKDLPQAIRGVAEAFHAAPGTLLEVFLDRVSKASRQAFYDQQSEEQGHYYQIFDGEVKRYLSDAAYDRLRKLWGCIQVRLEGAPEVLGLPKRRAAQQSRENLTTPPAMDRLTFQFAPGDAATPGAIGIHVDASQLLRWILELPGTRKAMGSQSGIVVKASFDGVNLVKTSNVTIMSMSLLAPGLGRTSRAVTIQAAYIGSDHHAEARAHLKIPLAQLRNLQDEGLSGVAGLRYDPEDEDEESNLRVVVILVNDMMAQNAAAGWSGPSSTFPISRTAAASQLLPKYILDDVAPLYDDAASLEARVWMEGPTDNAANRREFARATGGHQFEDLVGNIRERTDIMHACFNSWQHLLQALYVVLVGAHAEQHFSAVLHKAGIFHKAEVKDGKAVFKINNGKYYDRLGRFEIFYDALAGLPDDIRPLMIYCCVAMARALQHINDRRTVSKDWLEVEVNLHCLAAALLVAFGDHIVKPAFFQLVKKIGDELFDNRRVERAAGMKENTLTLGDTNSVAPFEASHRQTANSLHRRTRGGGNTYHTRRALGAALASQETQHGQNIGAQYGLLTDAVKDNREDYELNQIMEGGLVADQMAQFARNARRYGESSRASQLDGAVKASLERLLDGERLEGSGRDAEDDVEELDSDSDDDDVSFGVPIVEEPVTLATAHADLAEEGPASVTSGSLDQLRFGSQQLSVDKLEISTTYGQFSYIFQRPGSAVKCRILIPPKTIESAYYDGRRFTLSVVVRDVSKPFFWRQILVRRKTGDSAADWARVPVDDVTGGLASTSRTITVHAKSASGLSKVVTYLQALKKVPACTKLTIHNGTAPPGVLAYRYSADTPAGSVAAAQHHVRGDAHAINARTHAAEVKTSLRAIERFRTGRLTYLSMNTSAAQKIADLAEGKKWLKRVRADLRQVVASFKASIGSTS